MELEHKAYYYLKRNGKSPLEKYLNTIKNCFERAEVTSHIDKLIASKCQLPPPYIKHIRKKIYELRFETIKGKHRIFYFIYSKGKIILLDGYTKKSQKIPKNILKRVQNYYFDYLIHQHEKNYE